MKGNIHTSIQKAAPDILPGPPLPVWPWNVTGAVAELDRILALGLRRFTDDLDSLLLLHILLLCRITWDGDLQTGGRVTLARRVLARLDREIPEDVTVVDWSNRFPVNLMVRLLHDLDRLGVDGKALVLRIHEPSFFADAIRIPWDEPGAGWEAFARKIAPKDLKGPLGLYLHLRAGRMDEALPMARESRWYDRGAFHEVQRACAVMLARRGHGQETHSILHTMRHRPRMFMFRHLVRLLVAERGMAALELLVPAMKYQREDLGWWAIAALVDRGDPGDGRKALDTLPLGDKEKPLARLALAAAESLAGNGASAAEVRTLMAEIIGPKKWDPREWGAEAFVTFFRSVKALRAHGQRKAAGVWHRKLLKIRSEEDPRCDVIDGLLRAGFTDEALSLARVGRGGVIPVGIAAEVLRLHQQSGIRMPSGEGWSGPFIERLLAVADRTVRVDLDLARKVVTVLHRGGHGAPAMALARAMGRKARVESIVPIADLLESIGDREGALEVLARDLAARETWVDDSWGAEDAMEEAALRSAARALAAKGHPGKALDLLSRVDRKSHQTLLLESLAASIAGGSVDKTSGVPRESQATVVLTEWYRKAHRRGSAGELREIHRRLRDLPHTLPTLALHLTLAKWHLDRKEKRPAKALLARARDLLKKVVFVKSTMAFMPGREQVLLEIEALEREVDPGRPSRATGWHLSSPVADPACWKSQPKERGVDIEDRAIEMGRYAAFCHRQGLGERFRKAVADGISWLNIRTRETWSECTSQWLRSFLEAVAVTRDWDACGKIIDAMKDVDEIAAARTYLAGLVGPGENPHLVPAMEAWAKVKRTSPANLEAYWLGRLRLLGLLPKGRAVERARLLKELDGEHRMILAGAGREPKRAWELLVAMLRALVEQKEKGLAKRHLRALRGVLGPWLIALRKKSGRVPPTVYYGESVMVNAEFENGDGELLEAMDLCLKAGLAEEIPWFHRRVDLLSQSYRAARKVYRHHGVRGLGESERALAGAPRWVHQAGLEEILAKPEHLYGAPAEAIRALERRLGPCPRLMVVWRRFRRRERELRKEEIPKRGSSPNL